MREAKIGALYTSDDKFHVRHGSYSGACALLEFLQVCFGDFVTEPNIDEDIGIDKHELSDGWTIPVHVAL